MMTDLEYWGLWAVLAAALGLVGWHLWRFISLRNAKRAARAAGELDEG